MQRSRSIAAAADYTDADYTDADYTDADYVVGLAVPNERTIHSCCYR
jgi:hypothetical protein